MKTILTLAALSLSMAMLAPADVTINLSAGYLRTNTGDTLPDGALILLIAAGADNTFSSMTLGANGLVSGDDVILGAGSVNNFTGEAGSTQNPFYIKSGIADAAAGRYLAILWFANYTLADYNASLALPVGSYYGFFAGATTGSPNGQDRWVLPGPGSLINILFATQSLNSDESIDLPDAYPDAVGRTTLLSIPEPGTDLMFGIGLIGLLAFSICRVRHRRHFTVGN